MCPARKDELTIQRTCPRLLASVQHRIPLGKRKLGYGVEKIKPGPNKPYYAVLQTYCQMKETF